VRVQPGWSLRDGERSVTGRPLELPQQSVESGTSQAALAAIGTQDITAVENSTKCRLSAGEPA